MGEDSNTYERVPDMPVGMGMPDDCNGYFTVTKGYRKVFRPSPALASPGIPSRLPFPPPLPPIKFFNVAKGVPRRWGGGERGHN